MEAVTTQKLTTKNLYIVIIEALRIIVGSNEGKYYVYVPYDYMFNSSRNTLRVGRGIFQYLYIRPLRFSALQRLMG